MAVNVGQHELVETTPGVGELELGSGQEPLVRLLDDLVDRYGRADNPQFLRRAHLLAADLPPSLVDALIGMRYREFPAVLVVRGGPVREPDSPTPRHWRQRHPLDTVRHDFWLALVAAQLGDPVCWSSLQDGRLFNDVLPISGEESSQTGHGSLAMLEFHVEDCFSDDRCDALALLCVRNRDEVTSTVSTVAALDLAALDLDVLFSPRFHIRPDPEHLRGAAGRAGAHDPAQPVLFGDPAAPYVRVDPAFTDPLPGDNRARRALTGLCEQFAARLTRLRLAAGDLILIDNFRAVHGRGSFRPRYDGTDRWMRKLTVLRDLRRTRGSRAGVDSRVLNAFAPPARERVTTP
jgi:L-asparagine oxygenase